MANTRYVALLRGINVGGKNKVSMAELRAAFEADGHADVRTYINSGNVLFTSTAPRQSLEDRIERVLEKRFRLPLVVVIRTERQLRDVVRKAPEGFGTDPATYLSDVVFLKAPLTAAKAMRVVQRREGVDAAHPGTGVVYFSRVKARNVQSKMGRMAATPEYQQMTIRSWSTTTKLLELFDAG